ncbi:iron-containing alcohol dehydrogenase [Micropruina sonneratiae]|uniref:iron-containing alcohol dehydrogenase n=1 Tax=Micropruina sonneratiae TaxID=2986940 RepID=UPI002227C6F9|nr:iron-containing alcohol dehydrogenase [Micropruina sp. KQZ13P-5]MCW3157277.1 iron-containing alcohol dehydrogenase [Micropruina sp. KQZ13P-5]
MTGDPPMYRFQLTTTLRYGPDSLDELSTLDGRRVLIVTDAFLATTPLFGRVKEALRGAEVAVFDRVRPNPDTAAVGAGLAAFLEFGPEGIVALGGGSPIDTAKTVRKLALEQGRDLPAGLTVIPTTSGSGSEVTSFAVVTRADGRKLPLSSADMLPELAILDPEAVLTAPPKLTADSGMDAVSHAIEAYVATGCNDFSDALAEKALRLAGEHLPVCFRDGSDAVAREHQHAAACMAGIAFQNAGLGIVHGLSHSIGSAFPIAHGRLNGILLPTVINFNAGDLGWRPGDPGPVARRYAALARALGLTASGDRNLVRALIGWVERLRNELSMPATVSAAGVASADFLAAVPDLAAAARVDFCTAGNPVQPSEAELAGILRQVA